MSTFQKLLDFYWNNKNIPSIEEIKKYLNSEECKKSSEKLLK
jgi:hypothetical protein